MYIDDLKNSYKAFGLDPDVRFRSPEFLKLHAEGHQIQSKCLDALAVADWPEAIGIYEECLLQLFALCANRLKLTLLPTGSQAFESFCRYLELAKCSCEELVANGLKNVSETHRNEIRARISLRLASKESFFMTQFCEELAQAAEKHPDQVTQLAPYKPNTDEVSRTKKDLVKKFQHRHHDEYGTRPTYDDLARAADSNWSTRDPIDKWLQDDPRYNGAADQKIRALLSSQRQITK